MFNGKPQLLECALNYRGCTRAGKISMNSTIDGIEPLEMGIKRTNIYRRRVIGVLS